MYYNKYNGNFVKYNLESRIANEIAGEILSAKFRINV